MKYIKFNRRDEASVGRTLVSAVSHDDDETLDGVAIVDDGEPLRPGETEIDEATYWADRGTLVAYNEALPPPPPEVSDDERLASVLAVVAQDPALAPATKTALDGAATMLDERGKRERGR